VLVKQVLLDRKEVLAYLACLVVTDGRVEREMTALTAAQGPRARLVCTHCHQYIISLITVDRLNL